MSIRKFFDRLFAIPFDSRDIYYELSERAPGLVDKFTDNYDLACYLCDQLEMARPMLYDGVGNTEAKIINEMRKRDWHA